MRLLFKLAVFVAMLFAVAACGENTESDVAAPAISQVEAPIFSPPGGEYAFSQNISLSCPTPGAKIRLAINDRELAPNSPIYNFPFYISSTTTIKAQAYKEGMNASPVSNVTYSIVPLPKVAKPVFNLPAGSYLTNQSITISSATEGAQIRYTLNGGTATETTGTIYTEPIPLTYYFALDTLSAYKFTAIAYKPGMTSSRVESDYYIYPPYVMDNLPETGQVENNFSKHPLSYSVNSDGTVLDNVTGLLWQRKPEEYYMLWTNAVSYCEGLVLGGYDDWRLPNQVELMSIVNYGKANPAYDMDAFSGDFSRAYWTSTHRFPSKVSAWTVDFAKGAIGVKYRTNSYNVRCVRK